MGIASRPLILLMLLIVITDQQIGLMLNRDLQLSYRRFAQTLLTDCKENPRVADVPIQVFRAPCVKSEK
jgi:hypothetical protein